MRPSDLGERVTIGTRTDKGVKVVSFQNSGTVEGGGAGVGADLEQHLFWLQGGVMGEALQTCFTRERSSGSSGPFPSPPTPTLLPC